jgi:transcription-repair coupling factor (superfamily II helicase)
MTVVAKDTQDIATSATVPGSLVDVEVSKQPALASIARIAVRIVEQLGDEPVLYIANDDIRSAKLAALVGQLTPEATVLHLPASDALPGDDAPASPSVAGKRVAALRRLRDWHKAPGTMLVCVTSAEATAQLYASPETFVIRPPVLTCGDAIDLPALEASCVALGYLVDDRIDEPGEVAAHGNVADIFPVGSVLPVRIEVADGQIVALRTYDPVNQRTLDELDRIDIGLAREPDGADGVTLLAHFTPGLLIEEDRATSRRSGFLGLAKEAERFGRSVRTTIAPDRWNKETSAWRKLDWSRDSVEAVDRFVERRAPLAALQRKARPILDSCGKLVVLGSARDLRFLRPRLTNRFKRDVEPITSWAQVARAPAGAIVALDAPADTGFSTASLIVVTAGDLLGSRALTDDMVSPSVAALGDVAELHVGDVVVHEDFGIARVTGIETMPGDENSDALVLEFAGDTRRLVPAFEAHRLWRYGGDGDAVALDKLDASSWPKRRATIDAALAETATALIALAAERDQKTVARIEPDVARYEQFASGFPFTETVDQARAIAAVRGDLASGRPMDRLIIGDVGYGKTEVALRAAAMVALAGGQVAIAAPTTVLVRQHLSIFERRFEGTGIKVVGLSRLSTSAEKRLAKAGLADGSVQIVIGTAAVASKDVSYASLQLVVIDEEQRFGAADKAKLRGLHDGHVLSLSATPIPRTLQSALVGLQQMSVIATPPARRQPIRTTVENWDDALVRTALMRERARRGQSFVVVPQIEDMADIAARLTKLLPEGEIVQAHGKMPSGDLDAAMIDFAAGRADVLLATNIIEAGLDVPRANTMIVWRADRFGLSQLHQLRGRVGRGGRRGQILLLTDDSTSMAPATLKRLRTLQAFDRLGAGFGISARDLDMRGAGDLLGESQTGHMQLIGIDLYQHLLSQAISTARGETVEDWQPDLRLGLSGCLPEAWIADTDLRIQLYVRLARLRTIGQIDAIEDELSDRFGQLPEPIVTLLLTARIRVLARQAGVARIDAGAAAIAITARSSTSTGDWINAGLQASGERFILKTAIASVGERADRLLALLDDLGGDT